ncbi:MAG: nickel pincer cofactor biosynthesis protein LarB [Verrucomicrobia bacterium]|nr:nickel pincer cofactor biosynthesis protein LarB [Verrucomicrobiota bacterium]
MALVTREELRILLERFQAGHSSLAEVLEAVQRAPVAHLEFAQVDWHRSLRKGFPEVILAERKLPAEVVAIARKIYQGSGRVLITRAGPDHQRALRRAFKRVRVHERARCAVLEKRPLPRFPGCVAVVSAGTSDLPVAEEAVVTLEAMGHCVLKITDVGVAGIHRLLARIGEIQAAHVVIVVAGMEGALPSVVAGLISRPLIAVPTSVGYGSHGGGWAALLGMLNSCGSGVTVVNIDNGFGAGYAAAQINQALAEAAAGARREGNG